MLESEATARLATASRHLLWVVYEFLIFAGSARDLHPEDPLDLATADFHSADAEGRKHSELIFKIKLVKLYAPAVFPVDPSHELPKIHTTIRTEVKRYLAPVKAVIDSDEIHFKPAFFHVPIEIINLFLSRTRIIYGSKVLVGRYSQGTLGDFLVCILNSSQHNPPVESVRPAYNDSGAFPAFELLRAVKDRFALQQADGDSYQLSTTFFHIWSRPKARYFNAKRKYIMIGETYRNRFITTEPG